MNVEFRIGEYRKAEYRRNKKRGKSEKRTDSRRLAGMLSVKPRRNPGFRIECGMTGA